MQEKNLDKVYSKEMSSTLSAIMNEATMNPSTVTPAVSAPVEATTTSTLMTAIPLVLLGLVVIVGVVLYFMPNILNYLSLPEQIVEEKVKKEIDASKKKKFDEQFLKDELVVDEAGVLEEQGFCYIGTDRGVRSCIDVLPGDKCMSGKIFPRMDICVNPSLRL